MNTITDISSFQKFDALHHANDLLLLPNAWDARSAIMFEENKFKAVGTSSAAVANSLGYEDGENMPFSDYLFVIDRILSAVTIPLTVDIEMGYGKDDETIAQNAVTLAKRGVTGINIEDSEIINSKRSLKDPIAFSKTIAHVKKTLASHQLDLFINVRCDTYILDVEDKQQKTRERLYHYNRCGANGIFLPCISNTQDIEDAVVHSKLPLNVMCIPGLPQLETLSNLGVKRVSMGPFMFQKVYAGINSLSQAIHSSKDLRSILS
jgi:2-methylisocitrate lyase-like PEP mutase family enzyme